MHPIRKMTVDDLKDLYLLYVPIASRHPNVDSAGWWPAHELAHLLTVPRAHIGMAMFGIEFGGVGNGVPLSTSCSYEIAAMRVSRQLLIVCGREDLYLGTGGEVEGSLSIVTDMADPAEVRRILVDSGRRSVPTTRRGLERVIQRRLGMEAVERKVAA